jgi:hypothetical protein
LALGLAALGGFGVTEPPDRLGVDRPAGQLFERAFAAFEGVVDADVADLPTRAACERAVEPQFRVRGKFPLTTLGTRAVGT